MVVATTDMKPTHNKAIKERSDIILQKAWPKRIKIKTSKREIQSIRKSYNKRIIIGNGFYLKVPFKISYIFRAIIELIDEIDNSNSMDQELKRLKGMDYGTEFYAKHIDTYNNYYQEIDNRYRITGTGFCAKELINDFISKDSVFKNDFLWKEVL